MATNLTATASIEIHADIEQVWDALTDPEMIAKLPPASTLRITQKPAALSEQALAKADAAIVVLERSASCAISAFHASAPGNEAIRWAASASRRGRSPSP